MMCSLKKWMLTSIECVFLDFGDARGLGLLFVVCACVQLPGSFLYKTMRRMWIPLLCVCVLYSMGSRVKPCPNMGICDVNKSHGRNARF